MQFPEKKLRTLESIRIKLHALRGVLNISTCAGDAGPTGEKRITSSSLLIYYITWRDNCQGFFPDKKMFFLKKIHTNFIQKDSFRDNLIVCIL